LLNVGPVVADQTNALLRSNKARLRTLVDLLKPVVGVLRGNRANLVSGTKELRSFLNGAAVALGHGPWLQVSVVLNVSPTGGAPYTAADCPRYGDMAGPNCPKGSRLVAASVAKAMRTALHPAASTPTPASGGLAQRLAIVKVLLAPVLGTLGVTLR
jgi:phospholipid/cholesterol/gamma-HCH transport system substrate-binding protein